MTSNYRGKPNSPFWGTRDANIHFCEPAYARSPYLAEFWNATTNIVAVGGGFGMLIHICVRPVVKSKNKLMLWSREKMRPFEVLSALSLIVVGIGSFLFHGTQQYWAELLDELGLLLMMNFHLMCRFDLHPWLRGRRGKAICFICSPIFVIISTILYLATWKHAIFTFCFTLQCFAVVFFVFTGYRSGDTKKLEAFFSCFTIVSRICWEPEFWLCKGDYKNYLLENYRQSYNYWGLDKTVSARISIVPAFGKLIDKYETDALLWCHPIFHIGCYAALVYLTWHNVRCRDDIANVDCHLKLEKHEKEGLEKMENYVLEPIKRSVSRTAEALQPMRSSVVEAICKLLPKTFSRDSTKSPTVESTNASTAHDKAADAKSGENSNDSTNATKRR